MGIVKAEIKRELLHCDPCGKLVLHLPEELFPNSDNIRDGGMRVRVWKCPVCRSLVKFLPGDVERRRILELNSEFAQIIGWTDDRFRGILKKKGRVIWMHCLRSIDPGRGHIDRLFKTIWSLGFTIKATMLNPPLVVLLKSKGFKKTYELVELWRSPNSIMMDVWTK